MKEIPRSVALSLCRERLQERALFDLFFSRKTKLPFSLPPRKPPTTPITLFIICDSTLDEPFQSASRSQHAPWENQCEINIPDTNVTANQPPGKVPRGAIAKLRTLRHCVLRQRKEANCFCCPRKHIFLFASGHQHCAAGLHVHESSCGASSKGFYPTRDCSKLGAQERGARTHAHTHEDPAAHDKFLRALMGPDLGKM